MGYKNRTFWAGFPFSEGKTPDTVGEMLTIAIMSYGSLRIDSKKKDVRKVYQENGNLLRFADYFQDKDVLLADTPDTALIQVIRQMEFFVRWEKRTVYLYFLAWSCR